MPSPWIATLDEALRYTEFSPTATTIPTTDESTTIWTEIATGIEGRLLAVGITISAAGKDRTAIQAIEARLASADVQEVNEIQTRGMVSEHTKWLHKQAEAMLQRYLDDTDILEALGATIDASARAMPASLATDFPNPDLDTSDYESPLADWGIGDDL